MATLALGALGAAAGSVLLPSGLTVLGTTLTGAAIGSQIGALAGSVVDQALFGSSGRSRAVDGPRLSDVRVTASTEGAPIPRLYGRARLGGQLIWASNLNETVVPSGGNSGGGKGSRGSANAGVDYVYSANFAIGLCEGEISGIGRVWADGKEIDLSAFTWRLYVGSDDQQPDALIESKQGSGNAPAYRGLAYIVFEQMPLANFGNRIPQLSFEIFRSVDTLSSQIRAVSLIPGSGEFAYDPAEVSRLVGRVTSTYENVHTRLGATDWSVALDQLQSSLPNAKSVSLVVSWFGTSLDAATCQMRPCVESADKTTSPRSWTVSGLTRDTAPVVSRIDGRAAFGGTPSDQSVIDAIRDLKARGLSPVLSPFILMDVPSGNTLADPYTGASSQPSYPWRGRITISPAANRSGTIDKTAAAAASVAAFVGTASPADFTLAGDEVIYSGPAEFSFRRMVLHNAMLAKAAGNVDAFVLCSEMRGLTQVRSAADSYPFVTALTQLATDVRAILGTSVKILYAADWSEYFGHHPDDGSNDVYFNLDPLWSSANIDAIGVDCYWPLSDWRDGASHLDALAGCRSVYDQAYLRSNMRGGEGFDWYYASDDDRLAQRRTPIADGLGKPWTFRFKDLASWWRTPHFDRPGGVEATAPTSWIPESKPVWFMELGCPAVDKGANQPNVFVDPKSSESAYPYFSSGARDDAMQRAYLQAFHDAFDPSSPLAVAGLNPTSGLYGAHMLDLARLHVYCWDGRPYPAFPNELNVWGDGGNWALGHWITGRIASAPLPQLLARVFSDYGFDAFDTSAVSGIVPGFVIDRIMSLRDAFQPLELAFFFDSLESDGRIVLRPRAVSETGISLAPSDLVETRPGAALAAFTRNQETDLPASAKIGYVSTGSGYPQAVAEARRISGASQRVSSASLPLVLDPSSAAAIADTWLYETWAARERASFTLPPSLVSIEPGDTLTIDTGGQSYRLRITEIGEHGARDIQALSIDSEVYEAVRYAPRIEAASADLPSGPPLALLLDIPPPTDDGPDSAGFAAAVKNPWPGTIAVWRSPEQTGFTLNTLLTTPATTGVTITDLQPGPFGRLDRANRLTVEIDGGTLASTTLLQLLGGANLAAVECSPDVWEVMQFQTATLIAPGRYELSDMLRGQRGTDVDAAAPVASGARFILLNGSVVPVSMTTDDIGVARNWRIGPASRDIGDSSYLSVAHTFRGVGLLPLRPVHVRGERLASGDISLRWLRRTRRDGDSWEPLDVPLAEDSEQYRIEVLSDVSASVAVRTFTTSVPNVTYSAAQQAIDFGIPPAAVAFRIAQLSRTVGAGATTTVTV